MVGFSDFVKPRRQSEDDDREEQIPIPKNKLNLINIFCANLNLPQKQSMLHGLVRIRVSVRRCTSIGRRFFVHLLLYTGHIWKFWTQFSEMRTYYVQNLKSTNNKNTILSNNMNERNNLCLKLHKTEINKKIKKC